MAFFRPKSGADTLVSAFRCTAHPLRYRPLQVYGSDDEVRLPHVGEWIVSEHTGYDPVIYSVAAFNKMFEPAD
jgi:hypothetical protein